MGLSTKQVSGDHQGFDRPSKTTLQSGAPELPKPPTSVRRQQQSEPLKCPRCSSTNTKFCYYNNYNKSQPRHFCKSCKRHWTKGGTLRNVPIGGGRKNKRPKISNAATTTAAQDCPKFPLSANTGNQKSIYNILYQTLIGSPLLHEKSDNYGNISNGAINTINSTGLNVSAPHEEDPDTEFQFSSLSTFDMNTSLNLISYNESLNAFDRYAGNLDSVEESTFTTANNIPSSSSETWPGPNTDSSLELPNYWNWNEIDVLTSWNDDDDGAEIKP